MTLEEQLTASLLRAETAEALLEASRDAEEALRVEVAHLKELLNESGKGAPTPDESKHKMLKSYYDAGMEKSGMALRAIMDGQQWKPDELELMRRFFEEVRQPGAVPPVEVIVSQSPLDGSVELRAGVPRGKLRAIRFTHRDARMLADVGPQGSRTSQELHSFLMEVAAMVGLSPDHSREFVKDCAPEVCKRIRQTMEGPPSRRALPYFGKD